jgi:hypothetical protein
VIQVDAGGFFAFSARQQRKKRESEASRNQPLPRITRMNAEKPNLPLISTDTTDPKSRPRFSDSSLCVASCPLWLIPDTSAPTFLLTSEPENTFYPNRAQLNFHALVCVLCREGTGSPEIRLYGSIRSIPDAFPVVLRGCKTGDTGPAGVCNGDTQVYGHRDYDIADCGFCGALRDIRFPSGF